MGAEAREAKVAEIFARPRGHIKGRAKTGKFRNCLSKKTPPSADYLGIVLMAAFLGCLRYALEEDPRWEWLADKSIRICATISALAGLGFIWRSLTIANLVVDLRALASRNFSLGCLFPFVTGIGLFFDDLPDAAFSRPRPRVRRAPDRPSRFCDRSFPAARHSDPCRLHEIFRSALVVDVRARLFRIRHVVLYADFA